MSALALRRGTVLSVDRDGPATELTVEVAGEPRRALSYERLTGPVEPGDDVVVNVAAVDLGLGSGGFKITSYVCTAILVPEGLGQAGLTGPHRLVGATWTASGVRAAMLTSFRDRTNTTHSGW